MNILRKVRISAVLWVANLPMSGRFRPAVLRLAGIRIGQNCFVGRNVVFDSLCPENIRIGNHVHITCGCTILAHYLDTSCKGIVWKYGEISIADNVFIGSRTIIAKPCKVGESSIIGAGSVVTKDIPSEQIWAGNPAKFIKNR